MRFITKGSYNLDSVNFFSDFENVAKKFFRQKIKSQLEIRSISQLFYVLLPTVAFNIILQFFFSHAIENRLK
jgi:hypothetical protein